MNNISVGRRFELKDALKRALQVNTDRTVECYAAGKWALSEEKAAIINEVFAQFGISEWADNIIIEEETSLSSHKE